MGTHFFTNQEENSLYNKFDGLFNDNRIQYFDVVVGYLRASGYFKLRPHLEDVEQIRILVGIEVDHLITEAALKGLEFNFNTNVTREEFYKTLLHDVQASTYSKEVEQGILQLIDDVITEKVIIKAHPSKKLHSKIYIFRPDTFGKNNPGAVITGSSNLTLSGMERNFEFNVELRNFDDVAFALTTFKALWEEGVLIESQSIEQLKTDSFLNDSFSPFELYIKFLIEYFGSSIEYDPESITDLPKGYKKLHYQVDAVNDGYQKLMRHNGFFLADVVGLGKTIIATIIAKKFYFTNGYRTKTLVVHPPALENNWKETIRDFEVINVDFISNGSLHKIKHPEDYDLIIVDEAHKFRSDESQMFNELQKLCKTPRKRAGQDGKREKKVILVTATPLNNKPEDIRNQLYLFQDAKDSSLEVHNLQRFFRPLIDDYRKLKKESDNAVISRKVREMYNTIRVKVLEPVIVRRTRSDIRSTPEYLKDMNEQGITFPDIEKPEPVLYELSEELNELYDNTLNLLKNTKTGLRYYRYQAIRFLPNETQKHYFNNQADLISDQLAHIMKIMLVKRLDSSFYAFRKSLKKYQQANKAMKKMLEDGMVYVASADKINVTDFINDDNVDELEKLYIDSEGDGTILKFKADEFKKDLKNGIDEDQNILDSLVLSWEKFKDNDPKLDEFVSKLKGEFMDPEKNDNGKLVVFSESTDTTTYLQKALEKRGFEKVLTVSSNNRNKLDDVIRHNFDANEQLSKQKDDYNIVLTTEVLAEGVNLHRSNIIVNYDIPWNSTRLMQRIGRVNRVGTDSDTIYIYNFFPTVETDDEIALSKRAFMKLQAFHSALGEDSQIYSEEEEFESFGLFERVPEEDRDERLIYLQRLRRFKQEEPELFNAILKKIPRRSRVGRKDRTRKETSIVFLKNEKRDAFYFVDAKNQIEECTFIEAARIFEAKASEKSVKLPEHHHEQVQAAVAYFETDRQKKAVEKRVSKKLGPNEKKAIAFLSANKNNEFVQSGEAELITLAIDAIKRGRFQQLPRNVNKVQKEGIKQSMERYDIFSNLMQALQQYPLEEQEDNTPQSPANAKKSKKAVLEPSIILTESFTR